MRSPLHKRRGVVGDREGSPCVSPFSERSVGCGVQRQHYGSQPHSAPRGNSVAKVESGCSAPSSLGRTPGDRAPSSICHGEVQCGGELPLKAQSDCWVRVDASPSGVPIFAEAVVGDGGLVCHFAKSPLTCLFCSDVGRYGSRHGHHVEWFPDLLSVDRASSPFATAVGFTLSTSRSKVLPAPVVASSSCVKTLQRFARAAGFSSRVA